MNQSIKAQTEKLLTIDQVSLTTDIPVSTIRKYCKQFRKGLDLKRGSKNSLLFNRISVERLIQARNLFNEGLPLKEVEKRLFVAHVDKQAHAQEQPQTADKTKSSRCLIATDSVLPPNLQDINIDVIKHVIKQETEPYRAKIAELEQKIEAQEQQKNRIMELEKTIAGLTHPRSLREIIFEFLQAVKAIHQK